LHTTPFTECSQYLYRYISVSKKIYYEDIFKKHLLFFSSPKDFNDPFDCKTNLSYENCTDDELKTFFSKLVKKSYNNITVSQFNKNVSVLFNKYKTDPKATKNFLNQAFVEALEVANASLGVLCLSEIPDDILMWSHYANCHSGIVLQFIKNGLIKRFSFCEAINYCNSFPSVIDWNETNHSEMYRHFLLRKSLHWKYEKEWRVLTMPLERKDKPVDRNIYFPKDILTGVIMGCQISGEHKKEIKILINNYCPKVKLYYAKKHDGLYKLIIETN
jgi:hypothetical protein